ncbi:Pseudouridylate Synthase 7-Like Protein [Manis pentadactyla]|nr:Pseudouridylate Synthase 7-Like Protein [Manis pentadactyla]
MQAGQGRCCAAPWSGFRSWIDELPGTVAGPKWVGVLKPELTELVYGVPVARGLLKLVKRSRQLHPEALGSEWGASHRLGTTSSGCIQNWFFQLLTLQLLTTHTPRWDSSVFFGTPPLQAYTLIAWVRLPCSGGLCRLSAASWPLSTLRAPRPPSTKPCFAHIPLLVLTQGLRFVSRVSYSF